MRERYSIEVTDEIVEIYGDLTIEETFDFLSFFERKGYKSVIIGSENSTLRMLKRDQSEVIHDQFILDLKEEIKDYKKSFENECKSHQDTAQKLKDVEILMKQVMSEEYAKYKALYEENQKIIRSQMIMQLSKNTEVQKMMEDRFPVGMISRPMTNDEKQESFEKLVELKEKFPHIPIPNPYDKE